MNDSKASEYPIWHVVMFSVITGCIIGAYVVLLRSGIEQRVKDPVRDQTIEAAKYILSITEDHESLGRIGLCDKSAEESMRRDVYRHRVTSLNSAKANLHAAAILAESLRNETMKRYIGDDLSELETIEARLLERIRLAVEPDANRASNENTLGSTISLYNRVFQALKSEAPNDLIPVALSIQVGRYQGTAPSLKTVPCPLSEKTAPFSANGFFRADFPVPVLDRRFVRFNPQAENIATVESTQFVTAAPGVVPNAVLLEVTYIPKEKSKASDYVVKRSCALIGAPCEALPPTCLVFRFPQGLSDRINTPLSLLATPDIWLNNQGTQNLGTWEQASGGSIPGNGRLKLTINPALPAMSPGDALSLGIYHWFRQIRPALDPKAVMRALSQDFVLSRMLEEQNDRITEASAPPVNSCLLKDTGAREREFMRATQPGSEGQKAIAQCFEYPDATSDYPQSAMPLFVDRQGNLNLAGRNGFDLNLVRNYLDAVYATNIAALESSAIAKMIRRQSSIENRRVEERLLINRQELSSLSTRLATLKEFAHSQLQRKELERQITMTEKVIAELNTTISADENRRAQLKTVNQLTTTVTRNADHTASTTYELSSTAFNLLRGGLHQFDKPEQGFLIGRKLIFTPIVGPVEESKFFDAAAWALNDPSFDEVSLERVSPWFQRRMPILSPWQEAVNRLKASAASTAGGAGKSTTSGAGTSTAGGANGSIPAAPVENLTIGHKNVEEVVSEIEARGSTPPLTVVLSSSDLYDANKACLHRCVEYPFAGTPIPDDQSFYYCKTATTSGEDKEVEWSVVMRDVVFHRESGSRGHPIIVPDSSWTQKMKPPLAEPPGLTCEFQLRRPLPRLQNLPAGAYITDPNRRLMAPQVPPVPGDLM